MSVENALKAAENLLDTTRHPTLAEKAVSHTYEDKFAVVEVMTNTAVASLVTVLEQFGLKDLETPLGWVQNDQRSVKLRFQMDRKCAFVKKTQREIVTSEYEVKKQVEGMILSSDTTETVKVKSTIDEFHFDVNANYKLFFVSGEEDDTVEILSLIHI